MKLFKTEPVAMFGMIQGVLLALVVVLTAFDLWSPTDDQIAALSALYVAVTAVATAILRGRVSPVDGGSGGA